MKCVDVHPVQPLVLSALYSGSLMVWNYETQTLLKSFEATSQPIRCAKFITRKQWIVAGSDDMMLRWYNYNTLEKVAEYEAHQDYIRSLEVHPTLPYALSASDDMQIKLWDWEKLRIGSSGAGKNVELTSNSQAFDGHAHYIMCIKFNPKDTNTFATASLDRTIKFWSLGSPLPNYSLEGHEQGVNAIDFFWGGEKPYLISGADDMTVRIWDYQTKTCVQTLTGHSGNVSSVLFHPKLPLIISAGEDGTVRLWHSVTYRLETTLNYGMERAWHVSAARETNRLAIAFDEGTVVISLGSDDVLASMEVTNGKIVLVRNNEVSQVNVRRKANGAEIFDGEILDLDRKELGTCEIYPQRIEHNANGRFIALVGDGEYIIYTAQALRNKAFGQCLDFAWSSEAPGDYAILKTNTAVEVYKNFEASKGFQRKLGFSVDKLQSGPLLGLIAGSGEFLVLMHWETGIVVRKIDVSCSRVVWNQTGTLVALISPDDGVYILSCNLQGVEEKIAHVKASSEEDISDAFDAFFELVNEVNEPVQNGVWVGDCFLYVNKQGTKLNYFINGEQVTLANLDRKFFLLNYVAKENRIFLLDQNQNIISFQLLEKLLQYQTAVVRKDFDLANQILPSIPRDRLDDIARFLEGQGYKEVALDLAQDIDLKFSLAFSLEKLDLAYDLILQDIQTPEDGGKVSAGNKLKCRQLCDMALSKGKLDLAEQCAKKGKDLDSLLLLYSVLGDKSKLEDLLAMANEMKCFNVAISSAVLLGNKTSCVESLLNSKKYSEAAFFARSYCPEELSDATKKWKESLATTSSFLSACIDGEAYN